MSYFLKNYTPLPVKLDREWLERLSRRATNPSKKTRSRFKTSHVPPTPELKEVQAEEARHIVVELGLDRPRDRFPSTPPPSRAGSPSPRRETVVPLAPAASGLTQTLLPPPSSGPRPSTSVKSTSLSEP